MSDTKSFKKKSAKYKDKNVKFVECNIEKDRNLVKKFGIKALPVVLAFKDGERIPDLPLVKGRKLRDFDDLVNKVIKN